MYCNNSLIQFSDTLELFQFVPGSKWADDNRILSDHIKPLAHTSLSNSGVANAGSTEFCLYVLFFIPFTTTAQQGLTNLIQLIVLQLKSCSALIRHVFNLSKATKSQKYNTTCLPPQENINHHKTDMMLLKKTEHPIFPMNFIKRFSQCLD